MKSRPSMLFLLRPFNERLDASIFKNLFHFVKSLFVLAHNLYSSTVFVPVQRPYF